MANPESPEELQFNRFRSTLQDLLGANNDTRTKAEEIYDGIPASEKVVLLVRAFGTEGIPPEESELAAILLRRLFSSDFEGVVSKMPPDMLLAMKVKLLEMIRQDINPSLRKKISDVIAELARNYIDDDGNNHWPEFLVFLFDAASSPDLRLKEIALHMFASVPGIFGNQQNRYIDVIHNMLTQSLRDETSADVRFAAVKALSSFMLVHEKEVAVQKKFSDCLGLLLQFLAQVMESDERTDDLLRYLVDLVDKCPQSFKNYLDLLFELCLKCMTSTACAESSRHLALEVIVTLAETTPRMVRKFCMKHIPSVLSVIFKMMTDLDDDPDWDYDEDDDDESDSNNIVGEAALDRLACALCGKVILPFVLESVRSMVSSPDWKSRYAALMSISAVGEGCHQQMSGMLSDVVNGVLPFLMDSHSRVRYAACNALGQMSTDFAPNFQQKFGEKVINGLLQLLGESGSPRVQAHAGAALVNFFDDCPRSVLRPQMNNIADRLEAVLKSKLNELVEKGTKMVLEQVVVTIASLADSSEKLFIPYYDRFIPVLKFIIQNAHQPQLKLLRGKTIECISLIGLAVGKEKFSNDAAEVMDFILKSQTEAPLADDDPQLSYMIASWARICKILGKGFEPYLPYVMEPVLKAAALKPEIAVLDVDDMKVVENDDDWEFVNLGEKHNFGIRTAGLDDKATACQMLVCFARELKEGFAQYVEETVQLMVPMLKFYFHDGVRSAAAEVLPHLLEASKCRGEAYVQEMWRFIFNPFIQALESEPEADVLMGAMSSFIQCVKVLPPNFFSHEDMMCLINVLNKRFADHFEKVQHMKARWKDVDGDDEVLDELLDKEDDNDMYTLSQLSEVICALFNAYQDEFFPYFDVLLPQVLRLLESNGCWYERQCALCVFADIIQYGGQPGTKYMQYFINTLLESLTHALPDVRQTAAYCVGCLGQFSGPDYAKVCADSIPVLVNMINEPGARDEEKIKATENAISAIAKFLMYNNSLINMEELLPMWVSWLPIWEDIDECDFVYNFLCSLLQTNNPLLLGNDNANLPRIVQIFAEAFSKGGIEATSDVGKRVVALIKDIQANQELFQLCIGTLTPQQLEALHAALTEE